MLASTGDREHLYKRLDPSTSLPLLRCLRLTTPPRARGRSPPHRMPRAIEFRRPPRPPPLLSPDDSHGPSPIGREAPASCHPPSAPRIRDFLEPLSSPAPSSLLHSNLFGTGAPLTEDNEFTRGRGIRGASAGAACVLRRRRLAMGPSAVGPCRTMAEKAWRRGKASPQQGRAPKRTSRSSRYRAAFRVRDPLLWLLPHPERGHGGQGVNTAGIHRPKPGDPVLGSVSYLERITCAARCPRRLDGSPCPSNATDEAVGAEAPPEGFSSLDSAYDHARSREHSFCFFADLRSPRTS